MVANQTINVNLVVEYCKKKVVTNFHNKTTPPNALLQLVPYTYIQEHCLDTDWTLIQNKTDHSNQCCNYNAMSCPTCKAAKRVAKTVNSSFSVL
jgi:hypothetical protein